MTQQYVIGELSSILGELQFELQFPVGDQVGLLEEAGFVVVEHVGSSGVKTSRFTVGASFRARKPSR